MCSNFKTGSSEKKKSDQYRGSYISGHFIWNLWNKPKASFINFIWNDHSCKNLFIIYNYFNCDLITFKVEIVSIETMALPLWHYNNSNQVLCNRVWKIHTSAFKLRVPHAAGWVKILNSVNVNYQIHHSISYNWWHRTRLTIMVKV